MSEAFQRSVIAKGLPLAQSRALHRNGIHRLRVCPRFDKAGAGIERSHRCTRDPSPIDRCSSGLVDEHRPGPTRIALRLAMPARRVDK